MKTLYFDMDGVIVDFDSGIDKLTDEQREKYAGRLDEVPGIFGLMDPFIGAVEFVEEMDKHFDVYILSTASWGNPTCLADKMTFIKKYFGEVFYKKVIFSHNKHLNIGDFLIDDRTANGAGEFTGEHIHFGTEKFPSYKSVREYLMERV
jgi:5'-nucleotidase